MKRNFIGGPRFPNVRTKHWAILFLPMCLIHVKQGSLSIYKRRVSARARAASAPTPHADVWCWILLLCCLARCALRGRGLIMDRAKRRWRAINIPHRHPAGLSGRLKSSHRDFGVGRDAPRARCAPWSLLHPESPTIRNRDIFYVTPGRLSRVRPRK